MNTVTGNVNVRVSNTLSPTQISNLIMKADLMEARRIGITDKELFEALKDAHRKLAIQGDIVSKKNKLLNRSRRRNAELRKLALYDPLTGVGSYAKFKADSRKAVAEYMRDTSKNMTVLIIDGRGVKSLNDNKDFGREVGDAAIKRLAAAVSGVTRKNESVYRMNGGADEFAIILDDSVILPNSTNLSVERFIKRVRAKLDALNLEENGPYVTDKQGNKVERRISVDFSFGYSCIEEIVDRTKLGVHARLDDNMANRLLALAEKRMSADKERHKKEMAA